GRKHRRVARVAVRLGGAILVLAGAALLAATATAVAAAPACTAFAAGRAVAARAGAPGAGPLAVRLLLRAAAVGVAVPAGARVDAVGHVPGTERRRVAFRQRVALLLALLERLLRLLGRGLAADGEAAVRLAPATAAAVFTHVVEAAQFAALVGGAVAADVA